MPFQTQPQVLCVDDDVDACEMLKILMRSYEIDATCVCSAAEAWLAINKQTFDLYVIDVWLPHLDGFEFCRQLRETDARTPVVFYSGAAYDADKQKGMAAGANAYIFKPNVEGLLATMSSLLSKGRSPVAPLAQVQPERQSVSWIFPQFAGAAKASN